MDPICLTLLTEQDLLERYKAVMQDRFNRPPGPSQEARDLFKAIQDQGLEALRKSGQQLLNLTVGLASQGTPGPCLYVIGNTPFCYTSLSPDECTRLGGHAVLSCNGLPAWPVLTGPSSGT